MRSQGIDDSFLERPRASLGTFWSEGLHIFAGGLALIVAALIAPIASRSRATLAAALATGFSLLSWLNAPYTGVLKVPTLRYLLPTLAVAALTVSLTSRSGPRGRLFALVALGLVFLLSAWQTLTLDFPRVPGLDVLCAGGLLGALAIAVASRLPAPGFRIGPVGVAVAIVALAVVLTPAASGFVNRHVLTVEEAYRLGGLAV